MKNIPHEEKGILNPKYEIKIMGFNFLALQIFLGLIREKRFIEFYWGLYCFCRYHPNKIIDYEIDLKKIEFSIFVSLYINEESLICRSVSCNGLEKVYAEYAQPGSRLVYISSDSKNIYDPYKNDLGVYHIHDIINIENDRYLVSTGDSNKYLDEFIINGHHCKLVKRHLTHLGGFTASIKIKGTIFFGSDFSYRPNYILNFNSGKKYFLPKQAWLELIISIRIGAECSDTLTIITKELNCNIGHKIIFCLISNKFVSAIKLSITHKVFYETIQYKKTWIYPTIRYWTAEILKNLEYVNEFYKNEDGVILDVGGGLAPISDITNISHYKYILIDPNVNSLKSAPEFIDKREGCGEDMPISDDSVDIILTSSCLQYMDQAKFFDECKRVLKIGGLIAVHENDSKNIIISFNKNKKILITITNNP